MSSDSPACIELRRKVPTDWDVAPLADVTDFQEGPGILAKDFAEAGVPLLRLRNIEGPLVRVAGCNYLDPSKVGSKWKHFSLDLGDLLISTSASLGRVSVVGAESVGAIAYTGIIRFRSRSDLLHHEYLRAFLSSRSFIEQAERMATGSVIRHFGPSHLRQMAITLPPVAVQVQIAELFDVLDGRIALLRETNATLEAIAQALFKSWFVDFDPVRAKLEGRAPEGMDEATAALFPDSFENSELGEVPSGWSVSRVEDFAERVGMGPFGSNIKVETFVDSGTPVISGQHLKQFLVEDSSYNFITEEHAQRLSKSCVQAGDVIFTHAGSIGQVSLLHQDAAFETYVLSQRQFFLRCRRERMSPEWITHYFRSPAGQHQLLANTSQVGVPSIARPVSYLRSIRLVVPSPDLCSAFATVCSSITDRVMANRKQTSTLVTLRDIILPRLISGQIRLPEATEAVQELLA